MTAAATEVWTEEAGPGWFARQIAVQRDARFIWSPVLLIAGIWVYFSLPIEPPALVVGGALVVLASLAAAVHFGKGGFAAIAIALMVSGFLLAKLQVLRVGAPLLPATTDMLAVSGVVESIGWRGPNRSTVVLRVGGLGGLDQSVRPERLRLTLNKPPKGMAPGVEIGGRAYLKPLPVPVLPGGFDYGRQLYLEGIGATGRFSGEVAIVSQVTPWRYWMRGEIYAIRQAIGARIRAVLPIAQGSFAEALITGERGAIPKEITDSLQTSGLGHVLSISGLHMSLVGGGVFWLVRALLALSPAMALNWPIKKWAAGAALLAGFGYMLLAGADVATQRSYIMLAIIFIAVIADRPVISMRNLALAALIILVTQPSSALSASFHMSFMAVMGLAAFYEAYGSWRALRIERKQSGVLIRFLRTVLLGVIAMAATTLVAGTLSSIPAAYHFGRLTPLSLLTNMLALPVISLVVMPAATLSVLAMPLGLEGLPLWIMGQGLDLVMVISDWVAGLSTSRVMVPLLPGPATIVMAAGMIWLCLWRGWLRLAGLAVFLAGIVIAPLRHPPDILIEPTAANVAVRGSDGLLVPADARRGRFAAEKWLQAEGDDITPSEAAQRQGWHCQAKLCRMPIADTSVLYAREGAGVANACSGTDILIADFPLRGACRTVKLRIDRFDVWRNGAYAIHVGRNKTAVDTSRGLQGKRPWVVEPMSRRAVGELLHRGPSTHSPPGVEGALGATDDKDPTDDDGAGARRD